MKYGRLDAKAIAKVRGPAWDALRKDFEYVNGALLEVSESTTGELTTIYVKYSGPETGNSPYAVVWIKRATELIVGLSLPDDVIDERLGAAPKGCKYAGLTKYIVVKGGDVVPPEFARWAKAAYTHRVNEPR